MKANKYQRLLFSTTLVVLLGVVYSNTLAPDLTWANRGADGGDLITAAATGGVAHPSGYPTYLVLARLFQLLPWGTLAFRTNLLSAVCSIAAALIVSYVVVGISEGSKEVRNLSGFLAGLGFGLSPLLWSQSVITEVYTLHALFIAVILWVILQHDHGPTTREHWVDRFGGVIFGLALGNQLTVVFLFPVWYLAHAVERVHPSGRWMVRWGRLGNRTGGLLLGLLIYLLVPIWARSGSPVNWGNPVDLEGLWWLISGQLYQNRILNLSPEFLWPRVQSWAGYLRSQYGFVGLGLGFYGLFYGQPRQRRLFYSLTLWMFALYSAFAIGYNSKDSYILLIPAFQAFALWLGVGAANVLNALFPKGLVWGVMSASVLLGFMALNAWQTYPQVDASADTRATDFAHAVMEQAPSDAILLTTEDEDSFALWYYHYALGQRPDVKIVIKGMVKHGWYRDLLRSTYPQLILPEFRTCAACILQALPFSNAVPVCETVLESNEVLNCGL